MLISLCQHKKQIIALIRFYRFIERKLFSSSKDKMKKKSSNEFNFTQSLCAIQTIQIIKLNGESLRRFSVAFQSFRDMYEDCILEFSISFISQADIFIGFDRQELNSEDDWILGDARLLLIKVFINSTENLMLGIILSILSYIKCINELINSLFFLIQLIFAFIYKETSPFLIF